MPRPKGSKNKRTIMAKANADNWLKAGQRSPLDHILGVQHGELKGPSAKRTVTCPECQAIIEMADPEASDAYIAAVDAAPYVHAKLAAHKVDASLEANVRVVELDKKGGRD